MRELINQVYHNKYFRYFLSGGLATAVDIGSYFIIFNFIISKENIPLTFLNDTALAVFSEVIITGHVFSLVCSFSLGFITNFVISRYFVFHESRDTKKRVQLVRYFLVNVIVFLGNYGMLKLLVEVFDVWATPARVISAGTIAFLSFNLHKIYTFKSQE
jgi:putative flippase GtrA